MSISAPQVGNADMAEDRLMLIPVLCSRCLIIITSSSTTSPHSVYHIGSEKQHLVYSRSLLNTKQERLIAPILHLRPITPFTAYQGPCPELTSLVRKLLCVRLIPCCGGLQSQLITITEPPACKWLIMDDPEKMGEISASPDQRLTSLVPSNFMCEAKGTKPGIPSH